MTPDEAARKRRRHRNERIVAAIVVLVCAAAAGAVVWWRAREEARLSANLLYIPKETKITREIELLRDFVRIDTSTPPGAAAGARWIAAFLHRHGITAEIIESAPDRLNVYARIRGRSRGEGLLLFNHIDVVPATPQGWRLPPFAGEIALNALYGRGTVDMKALTICQLLSMVDVVRSGSPPEHDLVFLATADEETGSKYGMQWIIANRPDVLADVRYGITEGGMTEMMSERMTYFGIEVGGKQYVELTLVGSDLESARQARFALEPLMYAREPERVLPGVRRYFEHVAPTRAAFRPYLADIDRTIAEGEFWRLPAPYRDLTQNSVWVSAPEQTADGWRLVVRLVNLPDERPEARIDALEERVKPFGMRVGEVRQKQGPVPLSPDDTPLFRLLAGEASRRYKVASGVVVLYRSATDSRFLRPLGIICYGVSPYPVDFFQSNAIHGIDERIRLDYFLQGIAYTRAVVERWASGAR